MTTRFHCAAHRSARRTVHRAVWLLALACVGCAEAPRLTAESARVRLMTAWVEDLGQAYERQDKEAIVRLLPPSTTTQAAIETLSRELASVDQVHVRLMVDRIILDPQAAVLSLHWDGVGRRVADAALTRSRGEATIRFTAEGPLTALGLAGDLPFITSSK